MRLEDLPLDVLCLVVHFAMSSCPPLLGCLRRYGVVGTRIVVADDKPYRRTNVPPTPVVKRALMAMWRSDGARDGPSSFRMLTLGTATVVSYNCDVRGFARGGAAPTELSQIEINARAV